MEPFILIKKPEELGKFQAPALPAFNPDDLAHHAPDAHWVLLGGDGQPTGRCSLWWQHTPPYPEHRLGLIGHYAVKDAPAARQLLRHACAQLAARGCTLAVGPMDGNTWRRYRFITERGSEPPFFLEPDHPDDWPRQFEANGFATLAQYFSGLNSDLTQNDPRLERAGERFRRSGLCIRLLDLNHFEEELRRIYAVSAISFQQNFLYTPLAESEFLAQYRPLAAHLRPELVLLAELENRPVGFLFGVPDLLQARRGQVIDTMIVKTVAVLPERACAGLGTYLVGHSQVVARELGFKRVIHALMHETNQSRNISAHYAHVMRRYTLFAKSLRP